MSLLERIYSFHSRIQSGQYPNANDLSKEFEISPATAHRDIAYLRDRLLAPLQFDPGKNGYFYTEDGFRLPFEDSPKIVLFLGVLSSMASETGLEDLPEIAQLKKKLSTMIPNDQGRLEEMIYCEWVETEPVNHTIFATVIKGLLQGRQLKLHYLKQHGHPVKQRGVDPLKLVNYQGRWYLLAWCYLRAGRRLFHLSRMKEASLAEQTVQHRMPSDDNYLTGVFGIFKGTVQFTATIRLTGIAAEKVRLQHWHPEQKIDEQQNAILLRLPVADDRELIMKILQFGADAEVLEPLELRNQVKNKINAMARRYA